VPVSGSEVDVIPVSRSEVDKTLAFDLSAALAHYLYRFGASEPLVSGVCASVRGVTAIFV
jgi:hypothetical protein